MSGEIKTEKGRKVKVTEKDKPDEVRLNTKNARIVRDQDLIQVTIWSKLDEVIPSRYGEVVMEEYCKLEKERIEEGGDRYARVLKQGGYVSLWVNKT